MPEDQIAQAEIAALTRRFEEQASKTDREFGIVKSDLTALRLQVGNLDQKVDTVASGLTELKQEMGELKQQMAANQAQIIELLSGLVGKDPNA